MPVSTDAGGGGVAGERGCFIARVLAIAAAFIRLPPRHRRRGARRHRAEHEHEQDGVVHRAPSMVRRGCDTGRNTQIGGEVDQNTERKLGCLGGWLLFVRLKSNWQMFEEARKMIEYQMRS